MRRTPRSPGWAAATQRTEALSDAAGDIPDRTDLDHRRGGSRCSEEADLWAGLDELEVGACARGFVGHVVAHCLCYVMLCFGGL
jgi:hypothetical protein